MLFEICLFKKSRKFVFTRRNGGIYKWRKRPNRGTLEYFDDDFSLDEVNFKLPLAHDARHVQAGPPLDSYASQLKDSEPEVDIVTDDEGDNQLQISAPALPVRAGFENVKSLINASALNSATVTSGKKESFLKKTPLKLNFSKVEDGEPLFKKSKSTDGEGISEDVISHKLPVKFENCHFIFN